MTSRINNSYTDMIILYTYYMCFAVIVASLIGEAIPKENPQIGRHIGYINPNYEYVPMLNFSNPYPIYHVPIGIAFILTLFVMLRHLQIFNNRRVDS